MTAADHSLSIASISSLVMDSESFDGISNMVSDNKAETSLNKNGFDQNSSFSESLVMKRWPKLNLAMNNFKKLDID